MKMAFAVDRVYIKCWDNDDGGAGAAVHDHDTGDVITTADGADIERAVGAAVLRLSYELPRYRSETH